MAVKEPEGGVRPDFGRNVTLVGGGKISIPKFSEAEVRYLDDRRRLASEVDEAEKIGGCNERQARIHGSR